MEYIGVAKHQVCQNYHKWYFTWLLTHWGRVTHICVGNLTIIGPDNGLSPGRHQAIICTDAGILLIGPSGTNFREILSEIHTFAFNKMHLKMFSGKWRPFCLGLNVLKRWWMITMITTLAMTTTLLMMVALKIMMMLAHWGRDKMDAISQTTFSNAFSWMKMHEFRLTFHLSLF